MRSPRSLSIAAIGIVLAVGALRSAAEDIPIWPAEQQQRLDQVNKELRDARSKRFDAIFFSTDKKEQERLNERVRELGKERNKLLQASDPLREPAATR